jgi:chemotaxis family two-component system sensor kinase Cph1
MSRAQELLPTDEQRRLEECVREPIHIPGAIQPHGALLAVDHRTREILQVSANTGKVLGLEPRGLLGSLLDGVTGGELAKRLCDVSGSDDDAAVVVEVRVGDQLFDAISHWGDGLVIVEFEPAASSAEPLIPALSTSTRRLATAGTPEELQAEAAREVRRLTGFDHVMVYHFHEDGHGEIVAEDLAEGMEPYLGLHYPASDIPAQARRLYLMKLTRAIVTSDYQSVPLVPSNNPRTGAPLDLSLAELRSVSPHHLQFMRNMGQASSMSLSMVHDGQLIGMITCAHRKPVHLPYHLRRGCELVVQQLTLHLAALAERRRLSLQLQAQRLRTRLVQQMSAAEDIATALVRGDVNILDLVPADGATVCLDGALTSMGIVPSERRIRTMITRIRNGAPLAPFRSEALASDHPNLAEIVPETAGLMVIPFGSGNDYVAWYRREVLQSVSWLGSQTPENRATPLSPRNSFQIWSQSVSGRANPWEPAAVSEAGELGRDIVDVLLRRQEARLAHQGLHDALTGLPNRRLLMDRLERALGRRAQGIPVAMLFVDLDRFKSVNDTFGHDVGDELIVQAAARITGATRSTDVVSRFGGDEFLVLCEDTDVEEAGLVAQRILDAFREPVVVEGIELGITASVGVAFAEPHHGPADLLREADSAMYRSKNLGRNRSSLFSGDIGNQSQWGRSAGTGSP